MDCENMTWIDLVRKYIPNVTEEQADFILWEKTAFPLASVEVVEKHIQEHKKEVEEFQKKKIVNNPNKEVMKQ